jgi:hypothetical protein
MVVLHLSELDEKLNIQNNIDRVVRRNIQMKILPRCNATAPPSERPNKNIFS